MAIRVALAEDSYLIRESVERLLEREDDIDVVAVCQDLGGLLDAIDRARPDVVLTDIRMPPGNSDEGIRAAELLRDRSPETGVVVLSQHSDPHYALRLLAAGSERRGYLLKERVADAQQLTSAIREVAHGGSVIDPKMVDALVGPGRRPRAHRSTS